MNDISLILKKHAAKYPLMQPDDAVKLVFQSEFGGGHIIEDEAKSLEFLEKELEEIKEASEAPFEDIGCGILRFNLKSGVALAVSPNIINKVFVMSSDEIKGDMDSFSNKLSLLEFLAGKGIFGFSKEEVSVYVQEYKKKGCPPVSHSKAYKEAYSPAYRVLKSEYAFVLHLVMRIEALLKQRKRVIIAIDGKAASGKSTMAKKLEALFDCSLFHMDDFFLPLDMRTRERMEAPGGNIHYERFKSEVIDGIKSGKDFSYGIFSCKNGNTIKLNTKPSRLYIIEGAYSMHPYFENPYNLRIFMSVGEDKQKSRIIERDGEEMYKIFEDTWIPMEEKYFKQFNIKHNSDIMVEL
ncbi:MAG: hypothetical protein VB120_05415 [Lachnospiraceae bacterium]|nr:hypothetical protein [Lachnospiraceae bacterium]